MADLEATIESYEAADGYRLHYRRWLPVGPLTAMTQLPGPPRARVVAIHGIQSHSGWYVHSASRLCEAGFEVCFLDRRGSGLNPEQRGHVDNFHVLLDDLVLFISRVRVQEPRRPVVLIGVSWGGKLAAAIAKDHPQLIDAVALVCPGLFPKIDPPWYQKIRIALARVYYRFRRFTIPLTDPELFTATPRWIEFVRNDPLSLHRATAAMLVASARLDWFLRDSAEKMRMPLLLTQAGHDRIIDNAKTKAYFDRIATTNKQLVMYPDAHHTLEFEPDPEPFIRDLVNWLTTVTNRG